MLTDTMRQWLQHPKRANSPVRLVVLEFQEAFKLTPGESGAILAEFIREVRDAGVGVVGS